MLKLRADATKEAKDKRSFTLSFVYEGIESGKQFIEIVKMNKFIEIKERCVAYYDPKAVRNV